ncbi:MAG: hypothetical protein ACJ749_15105 [Flavisolibacter sp.]|jgi:hypothetical protein
MKKIVHIVKGWAKAFGIISTSSAEMKLSKLRLQKCTGCQHAKNVKVLEILNGKDLYENSLQCTICHCPCLEKSLVVDEQCPIYKW